MKKILSVMLALALVLCMIPALSAAAAEALRGKALLSLEEQLRECAAMLRVNVNTKHLAAMLATYRNEE